MDGDHAQKKQIIIGSTGVLTGIVSKPELNGQSVVVVEPKSKLRTGRIAVKLTDGREISVKEESFLISKKWLGKQSWGKYLLITGSSHHYCQGVFSRRKWKDSGNRSDRFPYIYARIKEHGDRDCYLAHSRQREKFSFFSDPRCRSFYGYSSHTSPKFHENWHSSVLSELEWYHCERNNTMVKNNSKFEFHDDVQSLLGSTMLTNDILASLLSNALISKRAVISKYDEKLQLQFSKMAEIPDIRSSVHSKFSDRVTQVIVEYMLPRASLGLCWETWVGLNEHGDVFEELQIDAAAKASTTPYTFSLINLSNSTIQFQWINYENMLDVRATCNPGECTSHNSFYGHSFIFTNEMTTHFFRTYSLENVAHPENLELVFTDDFLYCQSVSQEFV